MSGPAGIMVTQLVILAGGLSLLCLLALHVVSPEFKPSWRMVSEYATGNHKWLITGFFLLWGGLFDIKHKWHGLAFALGVPTLPVGALLISYDLAPTGAGSTLSSALVLFAHATWISVIVMGIAMSVMFSGFRKAGVAMHQNAKPPDRVPDGVIALGGYANRLLVICHVGWIIVAASFIWQLS